MSIEIRLLNSSDAVAYQALRLAGLQEAASAFASSYEVECDRPVSWVQSRLMSDQMGAVFGAFCDAGLVGVAGIRREGQLKLAHKAFLWGVYVDPAYRRKSAARRVVEGVIRYAFETMNVRQVNLGVNDANEPARRLYDSLGFQTFGIEESYLKVDGEYHNERLMVLNRSEQESESGTVPKSVS